MPGDLYGNGIIIQDLVLKIDTSGGMAQVGPKSGIGAKKQSKSIEATLRSCLLNPTVITDMPVKRAGGNDQREEARAKAGRLSRLDQ